MQHEKSCGAIIFHKNKETEFLLLHYPSGHWDFVKGNVEKGEKEEETALREAGEETGLEIELIPGFKQVIRYFFHRDMDLIRKEVVFFLAETKTKNVKLSFEHQGFRWLGFAEAYEQITYKNSKGILRKASDFLTRVE